MAELTRKEIFSATNDRHTNVKDIVGQVISPVACHTHQYADQDGKLHSVLVIKDGKTGKMFKTEVQAFIDKFMAYQEAFGDLPDEEKPDIRIACRVSKKNNKYANFDLVDEAAE